MTKRGFVRRIVVGALLALALTVVPHPTGLRAQGATAPAPLNDPSGATTGTARDVTVADPANPTLTEVMDTVGHNKIAINFMWTLITGFLVMFMQAGFALVETGFTRAKNVAHTMSMNFMVYAVGMLGFWICGFALQMGGVGGVAALGGVAPLNHEVAISLFGHSFGLFGTKGFFLSGDTYDVGVFTLFLFQMVFMDTAATIPTGAMAERWKFSAFLVFGFFMSMFVYPLYANWVWGAGWLSQLGAQFHLGHGHVDFAGSSVVHMVGGVAGLAGAMVIGPRIGKFTRNGDPVAIPGHHLPMAIAGTFILAFGWFGFNPGSTLAGGDLRISIVAVNTMLASAAGAFSAMVYVWWKYGKPDPAMLANGMLAGLVAITAPCAFVNSVSAVDHRPHRGRARRPVGVLRRAHDEDRRPGRRHLRARRLRRVGRALARPVRRRRLRGRLERRPGHGQGPVLRRREPVHRAVRRHAHVLRVRLRRVLGVLQDRGGGDGQPRLGRGGTRRSRHAGDGRARLSRLRVDGGSGQLEHSWSGMTRERSIMKLIRCIVRPDKVSEATGALERAGVSGLTVIDVRGRGRRTRPTGLYRGVIYDTLAPMSMIDVVAADDLVDDIVTAVIDHARTGQFGDGRVFVMSVEEGYTIRSRQPGNA